MGIIINFFQLFCDESNVYVLMRKKKCFSSRSSSLLIKFISFAFISSAGASSPAVPTNVGSLDGSNHGQGSKAASISCVGSLPPQTSLSTSAGGFAFGSSRSCRPWERGDLLRRLATFVPSNWFAKPKV